MRKVAVALLILLVALSSVVMAAEGVGGPSSLTGKGAGVSSAPDVVWPDSILWDQPVPADWVALVNVDMAAPYDAYDAFLADDFTNAEAWTIRNLWVPNIAFSDFTCADSLTFQIYPDAGGVPAGNPYVGGAYWSLSVVPTDAQVQLLADPYYNGLLSHVWLTPTTPPVIPPGTWWFVFYPSLDYPTCNMNYQHAGATANGYYGQVINPGGGWGLPTTWGSIQDAWPEYTIHDMAFRLSGSKNLMYAAQFMMTYREPAPGKYKIIGKVQIREASGPRVPGAEVTTYWIDPDGPYFYPAPATTNAQGWASFAYHADYLQTGVWTLCVTNVTKAGLTYDPSLNPSDCATITIP